MALLRAASPVQVLSPEAMRAKMHGLLAHTPAQPWIRDTDDPVILVWNFTSHPVRPISSLVTSSSSLPLSQQRQQGGAVQTDSRVLSQPATDHTGRTLQQQQQGDASHEQSNEAPREGRRSVTDVDAMTSSRSPSPQLHRSNNSNNKNSDSRGEVAQKRRGRPRKSATSQTGRTRAVKTEPAVQPAALGAHGAVEMVRSSRSVQSAGPLVEHAAAKAVKRVAGATATAAASKRRKAERANTDDTKRQLPIEQFLTRQPQP